MTQLPIGWQAVPISEIAEGGLFVDGDWVESKDQDPSGDVRLVQLADVGDGEYRYRSNRWMRTDQAERLRVTHLEPDDILVARMPDPLGRACLMPELKEQAATAVDVAILRVRRADVHPKYVMWALNSPAIRAEMLTLASGTTRQRISRKNLGLVKLPLPALDVQRRIVDSLEDHLSRLDKALDDVDSAKHHAKALVRSKRHEVFAPEQLPQNWEYVPISSVLTPLVGKRLTQRGWSPQCLNHTRTSDVEWGVLKTTAIQFGEYQPEHHKQLPVSLEAKPEIEVEPGDLIMTATGPRNRCGIPCLVQESPARLMMSGKMFRFRTDSSICDSRWLLQFLLSDAGQRQLENFKVGSSDSSVSIGSQQFENIELPLPPISAQVALLSQLDELTGRAKHLEFALESTGAQAGILRRSLLHTAFTGQLTTEDSNE